MSVFWQSSLSSLKNLYFIRARIHLLCCPQFLNTKSYNKNLLETSSITPFEYFLRLLLWVSKVGFFSLCTLHSKYSSHSYTWIKATKRHIYCCNLITIRKNQVIISFWNLPSVVVAKCETTISQRHE